MTEFIQVNMQSGVLLAGLRGSEEEDYTWGGCTHYTEEAWPSTAL